MVQVVVGIKSPPALCGTDHRAGTPPDHRDPTTRRAAVAFEGEPGHDATRDSMREVTPMSTHRYAGYEVDYENDYEEQDEPADVLDERPRRGAAHVVSALGGLVLTPVALGLLSWGGLRQQQLIQATLSTNRDALGIALLAGGAILLLVVAALGALSAVGPILGGLIYGVLPGVAAMAVPEWGFRLVNQMPKSDIAYGVMDFLFIGGLLGVGFLLVGSGLANALVRRRREG
jgi:hypothetical protein